MKGNQFILYFLLLVFFSLSCNETPEKGVNPPQVETIGVKEITDISATCLGKITDAGSGTIRDYGIEIKNGNGYIKMSHTNTSESGYEVRLSELVSDQLYYYRAYVDDGVTYHGIEKKFTTLSPIAFKAIIDYSKITSTSVEISFNSTSRLKEWGIHYSKSEVTAKDPVKKSSVNSTILIDNLEPATTYNLLPYVKDKNNQIIYLDKLYVTTTELKDVCKINGKWYRVDTLQQRQTISPGLSYYSIAIKEYPLRVYALEIDLTNPFIRVETCLAMDNAIATERPNAMVERKRLQGYDVVAATNGDFYFYQDPIEIGIPRSGQFHHGGMVTNPTGRACFILSEDGIPYIDRPIFQGILKKGEFTTTIHTVNMLRLEAYPNLTPNLMTLYTPSFGKTTGTVDGGTKVVIRPKDNESFFFEANREIRCKVEDIYDNPGKSIIPERCAVLHGRGSSADFLKTLKMNEEINIYLGVTLKSNPNLTIKIKEMVGGSDNIILKNGERAEGDDLYNPRTGIAYSKDKRKAYLMVADGRQTFSKGCTMKDFGEILLSAGAWYAINLDGGGSSVMVVRDQVVNNPSDGSVRAVGNGVLVVRQDNN